MCTIPTLQSIAEGAGDFSVATAALGADGRAALRFDDVLEPDDVQAIVKAMEVCMRDAYMCVSACVTLAVTQPRPR